MKMSWPKISALVAIVTGLAVFYWKYNDRQAAKGVEKDHADSAFVWGGDYSHNKWRFNRIERELGIDVYGPPAPPANRRWRRH